MLEWAGEGLEWERRMHSRVWSVRTIEICSERKRRSFRKLSSSAPFADEDYARLQCRWCII